MISFLSDLVLEEMCSDWINFLYRCMYIHCFWCICSESLYSFVLLASRYFICRWIVRQSCSIVQNLIVNYHLVVSYPQLCHIGINVDHWYVIIIAIHIMLLFVDSLAEIWITLTSLTPWRHHFDARLNNSWYYTVYITWVQ